jgi:DNA topoisomerase VI subunit A
MAKKDSKSKESPSEKLRELGAELAGQIAKGKNPQVEFGLRSLSNVVYDEKSRTLNLGNKTQTRSFFNVGHAKKFMQTLEMAKVSKTLLDVQKHASLRDVFYMAKRTIPGSTVNIVDEQEESDDAIEDMEIITGFSREMLNINANKMGSVAGEVTIEDSGDTINWAKLGSGGWSIPSNVENIQFKSVKAKYIIYMGTSSGRSTIASS